MCCRGFREEFRLRNFFFRHHCKDHFVTSPWLSLPVFLTYRLLFGLYFLAIWIWDVTNIELYPGGRYFIYLTNINFTVATLYFLYGAVLCIIELASKKGSRVDGGIEMRYGSCDARVEAGDEPNVIKEDQLLAHHKIFWWLYNISATVGLMISIAYWLIVFNGEPVDVPNVTKHILNFVFLLIETKISRVPVRLFHAVYAIAYVALYIIFTVIYWAAGGTDIEGNPYIYEALDWNNISTMTIILIPIFLIIVLPIIQLLFYGLYRFRSWLESKCGANSTYA